MVPALAQLRDAHLPHEPREAFFARVGSDCQPTRSLDIYLRLLCAPYGNTTQEQQHNVLATVATTSSLAACPDARAVRDLVAQCSWPWFHGRV